MCTRACIYVKCQMPYFPLWVGSLSEYGWGNSGKAPWIRGARSKNNSWINRRMIYVYTIWKHNDGGIICTCLCALLNAYVRMFVCYDTSNHHAIYTCGQFSRNWKKNIYIRRNSMLWTFVLIHAFAGVNFKISYFDKFKYIQLFECFHGNPSFVKACRKWTKMQGINQTCIHSE